MESDGFNDPLSLILEHFLDGRDILALSGASKRMRAIITGPYMAPRLYGKFVFTRGSTIVIDDLRYAAGIRAAESWSACITKARVCGPEDLARLMPLRNLRSLCFADNDVPPSSYGDVHKELTQIAMLPHLAHVEFLGLEGCRADVASVLGARVVDGERRNDLHIRVAHMINPLPSMERMTRLTIGEADGAGGQSGQFPSVVLCNINDAGTSLRDVQILATNVTLSDVLYLAASVTLTNLDLSSCVLPPRWLERFANTNGAGTTLVRIAIGDKSFPMEPGGPGERATRAVRDAGIVLEIVAKPAAELEHERESARAFAEIREQEYRARFLDQIEQPARAVAESLYASATGTLLHLFR
jgi:hypothetical protein